MKKKYLLLSFIFFYNFYSCKEATEKVTISESKTLFKEVPESQSGIDFKNEVNQDSNFNLVKYTYALLGGGVSVGDINNDGLDDIYLVSNQSLNKLYLNKGNFKFKDITEVSGVADGDGWSTGTSMIDINNDGWLDIYVCKSASLNDPDLRRNKLYINQKDGSFKEKAKLWGLDHNGFSIQSYFFDYDKDGDLDMYLVNHRSDFENTLRIEDKKKRKYYPETSDHLFRNEGNKFINVTLQSKLINKEWGLSASIGDFNNDSWPDIYVANDYIAPDYLYINNRDGTFSNQINTRIKHISYNSMGSDYADINNDLLPDLAVLEMSSEDHVRSKENMPTMNTDGFNKIVKSGYHYPYMSNVLQLNNGNGSFSDIGQMAGVSKTDWSWAPLIADFDNDGFKDLLVTNGIDRNVANQDYIRVVKKNLDNNITMTMNEVINMMPSEKLSNYVFKNKGDLTFENLTEDWGLNKKINSNGVAYADFDNDGDLDLVMNNMSDKAMVYKNHSKANYIKIKLKGGEKNVDAIGAKVKVFTKKGGQFQELYTTRGYLSSVTNTLNFGLGDEEIIKKIEVVWPNGNVLISENVKANQKVTFDIKDVGSDISLKMKVNRNFKRVNPKPLGIDFVHQENIYNDFSKQVLLPQKLSQKGPSLSVADINNDKLEDFYVGGASGQPGELYMQNVEGKFTLSHQESFVLDNKYEDNGSLFFDADGDGDLDLYVASGGYELSENDKLLQDRLYINDGKGNFERKFNLPDMLSSTKSVKVFDFDDDGFNDLFVGGNVIPGKYPLAPRSYILKNDKGVFIDVTEDVVSGFSEIGLVNDLILSDYDNDNDKDLFVIGEWMPIRVFNNNSGKFNEVDIIELKNTHGWWNTILEVDLDNDGDYDYVVGNLGENNKFHPTVEKPLHIYGNNFDNNDSYDMILSKDYKGNLVPIRGKECSTQQNKFVSDKMPTYKEFALSTLSDIYGEEELKASYHREVYTFSSMYLQNNGKGSFDLKKLPSYAQMGPTLGFEVADINNDGYKDIIGVGSIHETEVETIRYDANNGYIILGDSLSSLKPYKDFNFYNSKNSKGIKKINIGGREYYMIVNNNSPITIFSPN